MRVWRGTDSGVVITSVAILLLLALGAVGARSLTRAHEQHRADLLAGFAEPLKDDDPPCAGANLDACRRLSPALAAEHGFQDCDGRGKRVCLAPMGAISKELVDDLVAFYHKEYGLTLYVLHPLDLSGEPDADRQQYDGYALESLAARVHSRYRADPDVTLIALVPVDIYLSNEPQLRWAFGGRSDGKRERGNIGVISTFRMNEESWGLPEDTELARLRLRKMTNRYIALMHYGLPLTQDPQSVTYNKISGLDALDQVRERIPVTPVPR